MHDTLHLPRTACFKLQRAARRSNRAGKPVYVSIFTGVQIPALPSSFSLLGNRTIPEAVRQDFESKLRDSLTRYGTTVDKVELFWKPRGISISSLWLLLYTQVPLS